MPVYIESATLDSGAPKKDVLFKAVLYPAYTNHSIFITFKNKGQFLMIQDDDVEVRKPYFLATLEYIIGFKCRSSSTNIDSVRLPFSLFKN